MGMIVDEIMHHLKKEGLLKWIPLTNDDNIPFFLYCASYLNTNGMRGWWVWINKK